ncbi:hypothetical protein MTQ01_06530 [Streptomyces sp. XM4193]|uniref:hypothetical protein n=1 Tax=Streptomyces sp. XM4193 TaxID=2929782 RepID=UPI001FFB1E9C|nr:hypothetical protein [Streptomyces sp. XM4193]MCK1795669.1 hypothetical protein [Streptomyces sp. XM4193]
MNAHTAHTVHSGAARFAAPLRAVDRVEVERPAPAMAFRAYKTVDRRDPYMDGHFPGLTLLPATFFLEALRQSLDLVADGPEPVGLLGVGTGRWLSPVLDGEEVCLDVGAEPAGPGHWAVRVRGSRADGTPVAVVKATATTGSAPTGSADGSTEPADPYGPPAGLPTLPGADPASELRAPSGPPAPGSAGVRLPDYAEMLAVLPVAHPIVLVDRVEQLEPGRRAVVSKAVTGSEPCYRGMPSGLPASRYAYPPSLLLESFGQAAALLWLDSVPSDGVRMAASVRDCRFLGQVHPGAVLRHVVRVDRQIGDDVFVSGRTWDGDRCVLAVGMMATVTRPRSHVCGGRPAS